MFTFTNKEKQLLLDEVDSLKKQLKECKDNRDLALFDQKILDERMYYDKLDALQKVYLASDLVIEKKYREEATKASKLETELSILRAEVEVLRKLEDKSDEFKNVIQTLELQLKDKGNEYSDFIKSLELIIADNTTRIELMSMNSKRDEKEITELKSQLKEANDRIFAFTTKEPIIVRPETVTPYVVEPVVLSPKK